MLVIKNVMVPIDFHSISFPIMEVNGDQQCLVLQNFRISSFVQHKKELIMFGKQEGE